MVSTTVPGITNAMKLQVVQFIFNNYKRNHVFSFNFLSSTDSSVPMETPTIEMLIIVDQSVNESSKLLNPKRYGNAKVKIVSPNDRWCLPKNYSKSRRYLSWKKYLRLRVFEKACRWENIEEFCSRRLKMLCIISFWLQFRGIEVRYRIRESWRTRIGDCCLWWPSTCLWEHW